MAEQYLFIDCCENNFFVPVLNESATNKGLITIRGKFQEADTENKNKRVYTYNILNENVKRLHETLGARALIGELDHPTDSIVHFEKASHLVTKLWWADDKGKNSGKCLWGEAEILNTPHGRILRNLIEDGIRIGMSSRGVGAGKVNEEGIMVISENYKLITFDVVADPSTHAAFQQRIAKSENMEKNHVKNENKNIYTIDKQALIACLGGIIKERVNI